MIELCKCGHDEADHTELGGCSPCWPDPGCLGYDPEDFDGAPCCPDPGCPGGRGYACTFPGYADNH